MHNVPVRATTDSSGATSIEYALIGALVALVIVGGVTTIGDNLTAIFEAVAAGFDD